MYSDESAYFLTIGNAAGRRAQIIKEAVNDKIPLTSFHRQLLVKQFVESYSLSLEKAVRASVHSSYFEGGASKSGPMIKADSLIFRDFKLDNFVEKAPNPMLKLLVHGRSENERKIEVYVGKTRPLSALSPHLRMQGLIRLNIQLSLIRMILTERRAAFWL
jgi:hypothetical protein